MGQKDGEKWTAAVDSQPTIPKPDSLLECVAVGVNCALIAREYSVTQITIVRECGHVVGQFAHKRLALTSDAAPSVACRMCEMASEVSGPCESRSRANEL